MAPSSLHVPGGRPCVPDLPKTTDAAGTCTLRVVLSGGAAAVHLQVDKVTSVPAAGPFGLSIDLARP
jgi:hypothetical protein